MPLFSAAQLVGYLAYLITVIAFWQKRDQRLLLLNAAGATCFTIHYILLGATVGAATEILVALRSAASAYPSTDRQKHLFAALFTVGFVAIGVYFYKAWYDVVSVVTCILATFSMIYLRGLQLRYGMLVVLSCWLVYNFCAGSVGGCLTAITLIVVQLVTIMRMKKQLIDIT